MKITDVTVYVVKPRWIFLKLQTDEGINGWGECVSGAKTNTVVAGIHEVAKNFLFGKNPFEIEKLFQEMHRSFYRGGPVNGTVISGLEVALWDIKGKALNVPVYELLGGKAKEKVRVYSWIGGDQPHDVAQQAKKRLDMGFNAIKMNATGALHYIDSPQRISEVVNRIKAIRDCCGDDFDVAIDFHGRVHKGDRKSVV